MGMTREEVNALRMKFVYSGVRKFLEFAYGRHPELRENERPEFLNITLRDRYAA